MKFRAQPSLYLHQLDSPSMYPQQRVVTNLSKEQIAQAIREIDRSIELDRAEISLYRILHERLSAIQVSAPGEPKTPIAVDFIMREKDEMMRALQGLVEKEYDEINGKQDVMGFLSKLSAYAK
jgi:hypothetical protein